MCQVNNEREINILGEEEDQIGRDPIRWRRRRKEKEKENKEERKEKEKEKEKRKGGRVRESEKKKRRRKEKKKKRERYFPLRSPANRQSKRVGARDKVGPRNESYAWVPKSKFFIETPRGSGFLLYWFLFI